MSNRQLALWIIAFCIAVTNALVTQAYGQDRVEPSATVFENVNVVPMDRPVVLNGLSVLIEGDRIVRIGFPDEISAPEGARRIDGTVSHARPCRHAHANVGSE